jgi:hypothetical protein
MYLEATHAHKKTPGVRGECGRLVGDPYGASLWFRLADPGWYRSVSWTGCLSSSQELTCPRVPELVPLYLGPWALGQGAVPCAKVSGDPFEHAPDSVSSGPSAHKVRVASAQLPEREHACVGCVQDVCHPGHPVPGPPEHLPLLRRCGAALGGGGVQHRVVEERHP